MRLLIVTQIVDREDPILGFFHRWIETFARECESVDVICLKRGKYDLPPNVNVTSLGKEIKPSRLRYLWRFYSAIWQRRKHYDAVFVHMNPEYVILGGFLWRLLGKRIGMWYAHGAVTRKLHIATFLAHVVFTSTPSGFLIPSPKTRIVGQGIDTEIFSPQGRRKSGSSIAAVTVSRITPSKRLDVLIDAFRILKERGLTASLTIVGVANTPHEKEYEAQVKTSARELSSVNFMGGVQNARLRDVLEKHDVLVNAYENKSLDKALLEAMAMEVAPISSNASYKALLEDEQSVPAHLREILVVENNSPEIFADHLAAYGQLAPEVRESLGRTLRAVVVKHHQLMGLVARILGYYQPSEGSGRPNKELD